MWNGSAGTVASPGARRPWMRARPTASAQGAGRSTSMKPQLRWPSVRPPKERHSRATTSVAVSVNVRSCGPPMYRPSSWGPTARLRAPSSTTRCAQQAPRRRVPSTTTCRTLEAMKPEMRPSSPVATSDGISGSSHGLSRSVARRKSASQGRESSFSGPMAARNRSATAGMSALSRARTSLIGSRCWGWAHACGTGNPIHRAVNSLSRDAGYVQKASRGRGPPGVHFASTRLSEWR